MQISRITNFVTSQANYFLQSSWKGKAVQVLCAASILRLIYFVAFQKKTPPKEPGSSSPSLIGKVDTKPIKSEDPVQPELSYVKTAAVQPDFVTEYQTEFGTWLSKQMDSYEKLSRMAQGTKIQQGSYCRELKKIIPELKTQVNKIMPIFKAHPDIKTDDWDPFLNECDAIADPTISSEESCKKLKTCLDKLQSWDAALPSHARTLMKELSNAKNHPHYEFTDLQNQYFHYLSLHTKDDFTNLLSVERGYLATVGLLEMEDVDLLQLRTMQPSIERLRQLLCFLTITGDEERLRPLIEKEIEQCREMLKGSDNFSDKLTYGQDGEELQNNVRLLRDLFDNLFSNFAEGLAQLKEIEQKDIARQLILLKGYCHQHGLLTKWKHLNKAGILD